MAFGLAVYASPRGSPQRDARLASSCWSDTTGRAFHPQGSYERFRVASLHFILLSQAWLGAITSTECSFQPADAARVHQNDGAAGSWRNAFLHVPSCTRCGPPKQLGALRFGANLPFGRGDRPVRGRLIRERFWRFLIALFCEISLSECETPEQPQAVPWHRDSSEIERIMGGDQRKQRAVLPLTCKALLRCFCSTDNRVTIRGQCGFRHLAFYFRLRFAAPRM